MLVEITKIHKRDGHYGYRSRLIGSIGKLDKCRPSSNRKKPSKKWFSCWIGDRYYFRVQFKEVKNQK